MEENSCLAHASILRRKGFKCESMNLLQVHREVSLWFSIISRIRSVVLIVALQLGGTVRTTWIILPKRAVVQSIGARAFAVQLMVPITTLVQITMGGSGRNLAILLRP